jgi:hypothetical protein
MLPWWRRSVIIWGLAAFFCLADFFLRTPADAFEFMEKTVRLMAVGVIFLDAAAIKISLLKFFRAAERHAEKAAKARKDLDL